MLERQLKEDKHSAPAIQMEYPIIGKSQFVDNLRKNILRLSKNQQDIVLVGETGVGKGAIAKNIVFGSQQSTAAKPFVSLMA